jgi:hypothetical protein
MLGLGLASSHAPAMFEPQERWPLVYSRIPEYTKASQPHTARLETPEVIQGYIDRINAAFGRLRQQLATYRPEALIVVGDDQGDMFDARNNPIFAIYTGEELWGLDGTSYRPLAERQRITFPCHAPLARYLHKGLIKKGFDVASCAVFQPVGRPEHGVSHMVSHPVPTLVPALDIPIIPLFMNEYFPPLPTAERCYNLGVALADSLADRPERVAIYASGGLSHDPGGPRAGWVDEPLDRWFLERLERNDGEALKHLFTFDSDTLRGGTGEMRAWITVAGAMRRPATVVDYIRAHHAKTGLGFAYWPGVEAAETGWAEALDVAQARY